jgi:glycosyltransferase involved in cell wall biosynthesis
MKKINSIYYIAELNLPSKSAYSIHVMKMCEAFSELGYKINLFVINHKNSNQIFRSYNIKNKFYINSVFSKFTKLNFIYRIIFSFKILFENHSKNYFFISRSIVFSLIASLFKKKVILELHHEITGFSKFMYSFLKKIGLINNLKYIFLNKKLNQIYRIDIKNNIVLDDAVNIEDFRINKSIKFQKTCVYIGSFFEGKGIEQIFRIAKLNKNIQFHLYGDKQFLTVHHKLKNVKVFNFINYNKIPKILSKYEIALMPYQKKVKGRSSIWLEKYMSPLKMFDYLAAKMIIIASDLKVYKHILKNNHNSILVKINDDNLWSQKIQKLFKYNKRKTRLKNNAYKTAKMNTWEIRCKKIIFFAAKRYSFQSNL